MHPLQREQQVPLNMLCRQFAQQAGLWLAILKGGGVKMALPNQACRPQNGDSILSMLLWEGAKNFR